MYGSYGVWCSVPFSCAASGQSLPSLTCEMEFSLISILVPSLHLLQCPSSDRLQHLSIFV